MKRRYHFSLPFIVYCGLTLLVAAAAVNGGSNLLYWVFGVMASALVVSGAVSGLMLTRLTVRRVTPPHGLVGEPLTLGYAVRNRSRSFPAFNLHVEEHAPPGASGWPRLMRLATGWVMHVGPREIAHAEATFWPERRGVAAFGAMRVWTTFPFGLIGKSVTIDRPRRVLVFPRMHPLRRRVLDAIAPPGAVGQRVTQHAGAGDDYFGLREYRPGDSMRRIAWKRTANRDQLVCVERTHPDPPRIRLVVHLPAEAAVDAATRDHEELAITLAASIIHAADLAGYEIGLSIPGLASVEIPVRRGHWHRNRLLAALAELDLDAPRKGVVPRQAFERENAGVIVIHPDRIDPEVVRRDAWHFSVRQIDQLLDRAAVVASPRHHQRAQPIAARVEEAVA